MTVREQGHAVPRMAWKALLGCADFRDRLPCVRCGESKLSKCPLIPTLDSAIINAARDYVNGYGWAAAERLSYDQDPRP